MQVSDWITLLNSGGGWLAIIYIFFSQVLPKFAPTYAKAINKHITREDRLFEMLATTNTQNAKLAGAMDRLCNALEGIESRLETLEDKIK